MSAAAEQTLADGSRRTTGTFLGELYQPYAALTREGYEVVVATPGSAPPTIDPESVNDKYWDDAEHLAEARRFVNGTPALRQPLSLESALADAASFQGLVVPGGQGVMVDLLGNAALHALVTHFARRHQPIGLICHAPAVLTRLAVPNPLAGRAVTSVSATEEFYIETFVMGADARVRKIGERLEASGFRHSAAFPGSSHALRDCNLVTSQNPFSTGEFNELFLLALSDYRRGARCVAP